MFLPGMTNALAGLNVINPGGGPPPNDVWDDIRELGITDGWQAIYDFNNPDTWTLRDAGGGNLYYSAIADALGNLDPIVQANSSLQPLQAEYNGAKMGEFNASRVLARASGSTSAPRAMIVTLRATTTANFRNFIGSSSQNLFAQSGTYAFLISDGSTNQTTGNNVHSSGNVVVVSAIWATGDNNCKVRVNGTQVFQTTLSPTAMAGLRFGYGFPGHLGFCGIFQGAVSGTSDALSRMENQLKTLHGIA